MDLVISAVIALVVVVTVSLIGDYLYMGIWYYILIPIVAYFISIFARPKRFFFVGVSLAITLSYIPYFYYNITAYRPEGLLGLGHMFSLFGMALGIVLAALYAKKKSLSPLWLLVLGFAGAFLGFLINQMIVCNTVMHCAFF